MLSAAALILAILNFQIWQKERILKDGTIMLLQLAPKDPRSFLQGDYMALRYAMANKVARAAEAHGRTDGAVVVRLDANQVAVFKSLYSGETLKADEFLLQFRKRGDTVRLGSDAFFFEEGEDETFAVARFGEVSVDKDGSAVLVGMRDENHQPIYAAGRNASL